MKQIKVCFSIFVCLLMICLSACGSGSGSNETEVAGLEGTWNVGAMYYNGSLIDINDVDDLKDLFDGYLLMIDKDGSFEYYVNVFGHKGTVKYLDESEGTVLLDTEEDFMLKSEDGEITKQPTSGDSAPKKYKATILDDNTLEIIEYDAQLGKEVADEDPIVYVRLGAESDYIAGNKRAVNGSSGSNGSSSNDSASAPAAGKSSSGSSDTGTEKSYGGGSYQAVLDEYTEKMKDAVPGLVSEYKSEASGVSDINKLAEICNDKVGKLAEICNEGVSEMAGIMQKNGDSYDTYESWAGKLMDNYTDIAQEIQDAYLDSAM